MLYLRVVMNYGKAHRNRPLYRIEDRAVGVHELCKLLDLLVRRRALYIDLVIDVGKARRDLGDVEETPKVEAALDVDPERIYPDAENSRIGRVDDFLARAERRAKM